MTTNTNLVAVRVLPLGGADLKGIKLGWIDSGAKAAQNDTWTVTNAAEIIFALPSLDSTGVIDAPTIATNVITLTTSGTGATSALVLFR